MLDSLHSLDTHPRTLSRNIWSGICCATDQEIHEGMHFYDGAHGLCRLFSSIFHVPTSAVAGIYAALSPMNNWDSNVSNIVSVLRDGPSCSVNTTNANRSKALAIANGADPESILGSGKYRKVLSFYRAIANPSDTSHIPVDRHLICLALGIKITDNISLRSLLTNSLYSKIESAYLDLGHRYHVGNRLASVAWFVQRRIQSLQSPLYHPAAPICCGKPLHSAGARNYRCSICRRVTLKSYSPNPNAKRRTRYASPEIDISLPSDTTYWFDRRDRVLVYNPSLNPAYLNSSGWQYLSRYVAMSTTGEVLRRDEHVHHSDGRQINCRRDNLEVWLAERHGRYHGKTQLLYMLRDVTTGRWLPSEVPKFDIQAQDMLSSVEVPF